ncbi:hypothetical protein LWI29_010138 [Acer saccharum]|uniref:Uncharacterized protein n=1 Tax=Acer saccharum TaxID=4024 RepID=A0AA39VIT2_ACESA|nr:hypothetical protein LWI29_010138 [Acer saccharum]
MEEFIEEGMTDFEQLRWLSDHATMEIGTMEELEDEVINMLVWASGESHMEEESEETNDIIKKFIRWLLQQGGRCSKVVLKTLRFVHTPRFVQTPPIEQAVRNVAATVILVNSSGADVMAIHRTSWEVDWEFTAVEEDLMADWEFAVVGRSQQLREISGFFVLFLKLIWF